MLKNFSSIQPKVSVIIPTYNRGWILEKAINSVLQQSYKNIEIIVIDDGSFDNTLDIINSYGSKINFIQQKNSGVSNARNTGIVASSGYFLAFLDSDDQWLKEKISTQVNFFNLNPDALICQTEEIWIRNGQRVNPRKKHKKQAGMIFEKCLDLCLISPSSVMLKRSLLDEVGLFEEKFIACEDYDLWLRIAWKYPIFLIHTPLTIKLGGHIDQLSKMNKLDKFRIKSLNNLIKSGKLSKLQRKSALNVFKKKCHIYVSGCIKRGKHNEAKKYKNLLNQHFDFFKSSE